MRERAVAFVTKLHDIIDELTLPIQVRHAARLHCQKGCSACCADELTVFDVEAERIRREVGATLFGATAATAGQCAFLDQEGACRIYAWRPYVCRTQGLPLRWLEPSAITPDEPDEYRDIRPLNIVEGEPVTLMEPGEMWTIGPFESKLAELQEAFAPQERFARTALRDLFDELSA